MKFEDVELTIVPELSDIHGGASGSASDIEDSSDDLGLEDPDVDPDIEANVSADVLARVRIRGWVETTNCPARDSGIGENGEFLPANRCIFPDDWAFKAGGLSAGLNEALDGATNGVPEETRPNFDINKVPSNAYATNTNGCQTLATGAEGPFSLLDGLVLEIDNGTINDGDSLCDDTLAPYAPEGGGFPAGGGSNCRTAFHDEINPGGDPNGLTYSCRETVFPDAIVNAWDAPMPPALVRFLLTGAGFLHGADKASIYSGNSNPFYDSNIPAEPWIAPINADLEGYRWNTWGSAGGKDGPYHFWTSLADHGLEVISCGGSGGGFLDPNDPPVDDTDNDPCPNEVGVGVNTGGYKMTMVYSDNHGEAFTWINGDADLTFDECDSGTPTENDHDIVLLNGLYCELDDLVGSSTLGALIDYPDKRKHFAELSNEVTIDWFWGGIKEVTVEDDPADPTGQFHYVVFHVTDRDGFCGGSPSLHPVLFERVEFRVDSDTGTIFPDVNGNDAEGPSEDGTQPIVSADGKQATTWTFDTDQESSVEDGGITVLPLQTDGECQAWIHISESLQNPVDVIVTAFDPEGTVTFDTVINPTPTPSPTPTEEPTPEPTPVQQLNLWADFNCDDVVNQVDGLAALTVDAGGTFNPPSGCPTPGEALHIVQGNDQFDEDWGDADCDGDIDPPDALKILMFDVGNINFPQQEPCPDIGSEVSIPQQ
jgi:hypothetical protein